MGQRIAHEMNSAALPGGVHDLGDSCLDADMGVGCDEFYSAQATKGQFSKETGPECLGFRRADVYAEHFQASGVIDVHCGDHREGCDKMELSIFNTWVAASQI